MSFAGGKKRTNLKVIMVAVAMLLGLLTTLVSTPSVNAQAKKNKKKSRAELESTAAKRRNILEGLDLSKIVWPNPPEIARIRYLNYWSGEKFVAPSQKKKKVGWMDRLAGVTTGQNLSEKPRWQLILPNGVAVDSKNRVYIADSKVRAIFVVDAESGNYEMIKNGSDARFKWLIGLAIDDSDRLFASDSGMHHVLVFDKDHKLEGSISQGLIDPGGLAIDNENRFLYVSDAEQDLVLVYDADPPYKLLRKIGRPGTKHTSTIPGEFAMPTGLAVDEDGNLYVCDTWNDRIEVFDADGNFIRQFGRPGDGPGYFARPKGIAIDSDGHLWISDALQDRVQLFTKEGRLLIWMGEHGLLPGQFQGLANITIDKNNRVFTTEQLPGRMQIFRYITNGEAIAERDRRAAAANKKVERGESPQKE